MLDDYFFLINILRVLHNTDLELLMQFIRMEAKHLWNDKILFLQTDGVVKLPC